MPRTSTVTPQMAVKNGGVAARIRDAMSQRGLKVKDLNRALKLPAGSTTVYGWTSARALPNRKLHDKLSKVLGLPKTALTPQSDSRALMVIPPVDRVSSPKEVMSFHLMEDGTSRLRMDRTFESKDGLSFLRMMIENGLVHS